jgi:hypothetical protein
MNIGEQRVVQGRAGNAPLLNEDKQVIARKRILRTFSGGLNYGLPQDSNKWIFVWTSGLFCVPWALSVPFYFFNVANGLIGPTLVGCVAYGGKKQRGNVIDCGVNQTPAEFSYFTALAG